jgi:hypothetical protein
MANITRTVGGPAPNPNRNEILLVQKLLNKHRHAPLRPIAEDGREGPELKTAIEEFQRRVVKMSRTDGRVDPGSATFKALCATPAPAHAAGTVAVEFQHQGKLPTGVIGLPAPDVKDTASRYESLVTLSGGLIGTFRGSIYPDNMNEHGRLLDGLHDLYLGFSETGTASIRDLACRVHGFRAVLVINANRQVPVHSNSPARQTSELVHIHNGSNTWTAEVPMSKGSLLLAPTDWQPFMQLFLNAFPHLEDWTAAGGHLGRKIGTVAIRH